jgi:hypothetical protein
MTIACKRIVGEPERSQTWHVGVHFARHRRYVVIVECENLEFM